MPRRPTRRPRRKQRPVRRARKSRIPRGMNMAAQTATIIESVDYQSLYGNQFTNYSFSLIEFSRASRLASLFKFYKAAEVEWTYTPNYNTYQASPTVGTISLPYFWQMMNRTGDSLLPGATPFFQREFIQSCGGTPTPFNKKIVIKYKPNWTYGGLVANNSHTGTDVQLGLTKSYGWLACPNTNNPQTTPDPNGINAGSQVSNQLQPSADYTNLNYKPLQVNTNVVQYVGHNTFVEQNVNTPQVPMGSVVVRVKWIFKEPNGQYFNNGPTPNEVAPTEL